MRRSTIASAASGVFLGVLLCLGAVGPSAAGARWIEVTDVPAEDAAWASANLTPDQHYFAVTVSRMKLRRDSATFFSSYYPALKAGFRFGSPRGTENFDLLTTGSGLYQLSRNDPERVIVFNEDLLSPTAYVGGQFSLTLALIGVQSRDLANSTLPLLDEMSGVASAASSILSAAIPVVSFVRLGIESLTRLGGEEVRFQAGVETTWDAPRPGYWALVFDERNEIDKARLAVTRSGRDERTLTYEGVELTGVSWALVRLRPYESHPNIRQLPGLQEEENKVWDRLAKLDFADAEKQLVAYEAFLLAYEDLLWKDRIGRANTVRVDFAERRRTIEDRAAGLVSDRGVDLPALHELQVAYLDQGVVPADAALARALSGIAEVARGIP